MKKNGKIFVTFVLLLTLAVLSVALIACKDKGGGNSAFNGKYYLYEDGKLDKSEFFELIDGKWTDEDGASGTFVSEGESVTFYASVSDENVELCSGKIADYTLTITVGGITKVFKIDAGNLPYDEETKLQTPAVQATATEIKWTAVAGAQKYEAIIDGEKQELGADVTSIAVTDPEVGEHKASVKAKAKKEKYDSDYGEASYTFDLFASGNGTSAKPYGLKTAAHLANISYFPSANYVVKKDNEFSGATLTIEMPKKSDKENEKVAFSGTIKAEEGATLDGVVLSKKLFDLAENAILDGVKITNAEFEGSLEAVIGKNNGKMLNCELSGKFTGDDAYSTAAFVQTNAGVMENCVFKATSDGFVTAIYENKGEIKGFRSAVTLAADNTDEEIKSTCIGLKYGMICAYNYGVIDGATVSGEMTLNLVYEGNALYGSGSSSAAIATAVGENYGEIKKSFSSASIKGTIYDKYDTISAAGFVGATDNGYQTSGLITECGFGGEFELTVDRQSGQVVIGGFAARILGGTIEHCLSESETTVICKTFDPSTFGWSAASGKYGGFAGINADGEIKDSFACGLNISDKPGDSKWRADDFGIIVNDGRNESCFTAKSEKITLSEEFWFTPKDRKPLLLAFNEVGKITDSLVLSRNGNVLSWNEVDGADYYEYTVDGKTFYTEDTSATVVFEAGGVVTVSVRPCSYTKRSGDAAVVNVNVKTVKFTFVKDDEPAEETFRIGEGGVITVNDFNASKTGHTFAHFKTENETYMSGDTITVTEDMTLEAVFVINEYNLRVVFKDDRSNEKTVVERREEYGAVLELPEPVLDGLDPSGYVFVAWDAQGYENMPASDLTVYGIFEIKKFSVRLMPNYDDLPASSVVGVYYNEQARVASLGAPKRAGYNYEGAYKEAECLTPATDFIMPAADVTFYAKWQIIDYTITVDKNGGECEEIPSSYRVTDDEIVLPTATKKGYTFNGWILDGGDTVTSILPEETVKDVLLTASFTVNKYNLTLNTTGDGVRNGTCNVTFHYGKPDYPFNTKETITVTRGEKVFAPKQSSYSRAIIKGWYTADKYEKYSSRYDETGYFDFNSTPIYDDLDLYLDCTNIDSRVYDKYNAYKTSSQDYGSVGKEYGIVCDSVDDRGLNARKLRAKFITGMNPGNNANLTDFTKDFKIVVTTKQASGAGDYTNLGSRFTAKAVNLSTNETYTFTITRLPNNAASVGHHYYVMSLKNNANYSYKTLKCGTAYAIEVDCLKDDYIDSVQITHKAEPYVYKGYGSGDLYAGNKEVTFGEAIGELPVLSKIGYTFDGWYKGEERITEETVMTYDEDIAIKAKFTIIKCAVEYEMNGGTPKTEYPTEYDAENPIILINDDMRPEKEGYVFIDWYTTPDFRDGTRTGGVSYWNAPNGMKLYAKFEKQYTLSFVVPEGVKAIEPRKLLYDAAVYNLPTPTKEGYTFDGWYLDSEFTNKVTGTFHMPKSDATLYARFVKNETETATE